MYVYKLTRKALRLFYYEVILKKNFQWVSEREERKNSFNKFNVAVVHKEWENFVNLRKENENHNLFSSWFINLISVHHA